ncbi:MAG TPA: DUF1993 domain-containing protein [Solimonas sp.]
MSLSMYALSVPNLQRLLRNLRTILEKGAAHAEVHKIEPAALLGFRLFPDMYPLTRQVQIATDMAKGCAARLGGVDVPRYEDNETAFDTLLARIDKTLAFIDSVPAAGFDGAQAREIVMKTPRSELRFANGVEYLQGFVLPNLHFHCTTAYNILRHNGVVLSKQDYLGGI